MHEELVSTHLLERCKSGDHQAWAELVGMTHREVYTLCYRILRDPDDASEATQDAYLKVFKGLGGFRGDAAFTTWLYRVASNTAISKQRSRKRRRSREVSDDELEQVAGSASTEAAAGARFDVAAVERALQALPEHHRTAVVMKDVYGWSIEEIATQLKISETAAKVRVHRARKRLKDMMYGEGSEEQG